MIPWLITVTTDLVPDQILAKLADMTGTEYKTPFRIFGNTDYSATPTKSFAGSVNAGSRTFRLVRDPHRVFNRLNYRAWLAFRTVYQGNVKVQGGKSIITVWVRPSVWGIGFLVLLFWFSYTLIKMAHDQGFTAFILLLFWGSVFTISVYMDISKAREMFERLFPDVERPIAKKERPLKLSRRKW